MKISLLIPILCCSVALSAQSYRSAGSNRPNFSTHQQTEEGVSAGEEDAAQPRTRTFSSYGARQRAWSNGVKTEGVKTQTVGKNTFEDKAEEAGQQAAANLNGNLGAASPKGTPAKKPKGASSGTPDSKQQPEPKGQEKAPEQPADPMAALAQNPEAAAAMQQMQGMQDMLKMMGASGNAAGGGAAMPAGMPDMSALMGGAGGGMPDLSALMGGGAAGGAKPGKK